MTTFKISPYNKLFEVSEYQKGETASGGAILAYFTTEEGVKEYVDLKNAQIKLALIEEISKRHPAYGVDKGYSYYTGGMKDTGDWLTKKMLGTPYEDLQAFLDEIIQEENLPKQPELSYEEQMGAYKKFRSDHEIKKFFPDKNP